MDVTSGVSVGRTVLYTLTAQDASEINRRRDDFQKHGPHAEPEKWSLGAQAHIGNRAEEGEVYPMVVVRHWGGTTVNGKVLLDGNDDFWATSRLEGNGPGFWKWPERK